MDYIPLIDVNELGKKQKRKAAIWYYVAILSINVGLAAAILAKLMERGVL